MTLTDTPVLPTATEPAIAEIRRYSAPNYDPLPVVIATASGSRVTDVDGKVYLDFLAGYSALNFGHRHPALVAAAVEQLGRVTMTSRAFHSDQLGPFCAELSALTGTDMVLPMNTGAEAVETAIKLARAYAYRVRGVPAGQARIVVAGGNFHGRTITIISFSTDPTARRDFGPYTPGFLAVPYGDADAMRAAVDECTAAVLVEPIQGEAGVVVPPPGYLAAVREACDTAGALLIADEVQSGLGRAGAVLAADLEGVRADLYTLGKALGGGIIPVSAVVGRADVLGVLRAGEHGSTFGGNPLACAVGRAVLRLLATGEPQHRSAVLGAYLHDRLGELVGHGVSAVRGRGLWAGVDLRPDGPTGRQACAELARRGVLCKETHGRTLRLAPPLLISREELEEGLDTITAVLAG